MNRFIKFEHLKKYPGKTCKKSGKTCKKSGKNLLKMSAALTWEFLHHELHPAHAQVQLVDKVLCEVTEFQVSEKKEFFYIVWQYAGDRIGQDLSSFSNLQYSQFISLIS